MKGKHLRPALSVALALACATGTAHADRRASNSPYVQSMQGPSVFYARCVPEKSEGSEGVTKVYRVGREQD